MPKDGSTDRAGSDLKSDPTFTGPKPANPTTEFNSAHHRVKHGSCRRHHRTCEVMMTAQTPVLIFTPVGD